jgi:hypothetical protein
MGRTYQIEPDSMCNPAALLEASLLARRALGRSSNSRRDAAALDSGEHRGLQLSVRPAEDVEVLSYANDEGIISAVRICLNRLCESVSSISGNKNQLCVE